MSLLRFVARSLFAGYFISEGVRAARQPEERAPEAERIAATVTPVLQRVVPASVSSYVPEKATTWVRAVGVSQVVGGLMFATGIGRRLGALLLANGSAVNLAMALPPKDAPKRVREAARPEVLRSATLIGASLLGALDTQGRPGLKWRTAQVAKAAERKSSARAKRMAKRIKDAS